MSSDKNDIIVIYSHVVSQVIFISTSGIAAGVTLLQTSVVQINYLLVCSFIFFTVSLICGVFGLTVLLGQVDSGNPDIHRGIVRWPNLISIFSFIIGVICFVILLLMHFFSEQKTHITSKVQIINMESNKGGDLYCAIGKMNREQKLLLSHFIEKTFPATICKTE